MRRTPIILILGPTAGGKTQLSLDLAQRLPAGGEIISCDSMQVYRGMDIGTAKPSQNDRAAVPHHLIDIIDPSDDSFSVDRWLELANQTIQAIHARGRWPIIVGGTNLYVQAFLGGMMEGPPPNDQLRAELNQLELPALRTWLQRVDPVAASRIHINDRKRTVRAIEVFESTGMRLSDQQTQWMALSSRRSALESNSTTQPPTADSRQSAVTSPIIIGLEYPVEVINRRINARVKLMIEAGFVDEVRRLHQSNVMGRNAREALGYKQIIEFLEGRCSLDDAIEQIKIRTRRYAKQQRTWLRRFRMYEKSAWIQSGELTPQAVADQALALILKRSDMVDEVSVDRGSG